MRALVLGDNVELIRDYPTPDQRSLPDGEALVRVRQAGICNTDLELVRGYADFRGVLGHEFVGVVEACPSDPAWVGRRVVGEINIACGACDMCRAGQPTHCPTRSALGIRGRDGAFADFLTLPVKNLHVVPGKVSDDQAVFVEPLAAALEIITQIHVRPTDRVLVLGDGKLGQLIAQVLALSGCDLTVIGRYRNKLSILDARGIDTRWVNGSSQGLALSADVVVEATGSAAGYADALRLVRPRGMVVLKSTFHDLAQSHLATIVVNEVRMIGSRCGPFEPALRLLAQGWVNIESLIQARYSLDRGMKALERASARGALKVLIEM